MRNILFLPSPARSASAAAIRAARDAYGRRLTISECEADGEPARGAALAPFLADADAIIVQGATLGPEQIESARRCALVLHAGPGPGGVDLEAARRNGILVVSIPDGATEELAELALGEIRRFAELIRAGRTSASRVPLRLGIAGLGSVGRVVAARAATLGLEVWATDPFVMDETYRLARARKIEWPELLSLVDFVTLHHPPAGDGPTIDTAALELMKPGACLLNTSHPDLIDLDSALRALESGQLAAAAIPAAAMAAGAIPAAALMVRPPNSDQYASRLPSAYASRLPGTTPTGLYSKAQGQREARHPGYRDNLPIAKNPVGVLQNDALSNRHGAAVTRPAPRGQQSAPTSALIESLQKAGRLRLLEIDFSLDERVRDRLFDRAVKIIADYFAGHEPLHHLIDPALPRGLSKV